MYCTRVWTATTTVTINCPTPLGWFEMDAVYNNGVVDVLWATVWEENTSHFVVQRSSDGVNFYDLNQQPAAGNSNTVREYGFTDTEPLSGTSYYRVVQYDQDGKYS